MKRIFLFRLTAIILLSVPSLFLRSEKVACGVNSFTCKINRLNNAKSAQLINSNGPNATKNKDGLLPYYPLIIKI